jgi:hypothetical protein
VPSRSTAATVAIALAVAAALVLAPAVAAAPRVGERAAIAAFLREDKVAAWLERYPERGRVSDADFNEKQGAWRVHVWWKEAGEIATGSVSADGRLLEAWTGPQVAWTMARGYRGWFAGKTVTSLPVWLGFCLVFLLGLADLRRPFRLRNLDLLVLLSFSVSLWFFNRGDVFTAMPLVYPALAYLLGRMVLAVTRVRRPASRPVWPVWVLAAATVFLMGFRIGLNVEASSVIDVGYSGVVGADRVAHGRAPYGNFPVEDGLKPCGPANAEGEIRERIQTNGRCESANERGDTYGPVAYSAYLPAYWLFGWSGKWDSLPAAHATSILFDVLCLIGLALVGRRYGGNRLATTLAFAWAAYPFTEYLLNSNSNDAIAPAFLIWGFWLAGSAWARGALGALAGWTKFFSLALVPLWLSYRRRRLPSQAAFLAGFTLATLAVFSVLLLEPNPLHAARLFWDRTLAWQLDRPSPFSLWSWGQYHAAGIPDLQLARRALQGLLVLGAVAAYFVPRRKSPLQLAALTAAILIGVELVLTHWFYLYIPWFFPFVALTVLASRPARRRTAVPPARPQLDETALPIALEAKQVAAATKRG